MMPAMDGALQKLSVFKSVIGLNGPGVLETALQVQTVHPARVQGHTDIPAFTTAAGHPSYI